MPSSPVSGQNRPLRRGDPIAARALNRLADSAWRNLLAAGAAAGGSFPGGSFIFPPLVLPSGGSAQTIFPPWYPFLTKDGSGNWQMNFYAGTVAGMLASGWNSALALTQSTLNYVYLEMTASGKNLTGATLAASTTYPTLANATSAAPPSSFNIPIAAVDLTAGSPVPVNLVGFGNIWVTPYVAELDTINTGSLLTAPFTPWYNWQWGAGSD